MKRINWKFLLIMAGIICYGAFFMYFGVDSKWRYFGLGIVFIVMGIIFLYQQIKSKKDKKEGDEN